MIERPYQTDDSGSFWDYSINIAGITYEISIHKKTGEMSINKDEDQSRGENSKKFCSCCQLSLMKEEEESKEGKCAPCVKGNCLTCNPIEEKGWS